MIDNDIFRVISDLLKNNKYFHPRINLETINELTYILSY
jgi:hypothetical protein